MLSSNYFNVSADANSSIWDFYTTQLPLGIMLWPKYMHLKITFKLLWFQDILGKNNNNNYKIKKNKK